MVITDIRQIDRIAEETFGKTEGFVSVDMTDYAFIKERSGFLKAIKLEVPALAEDVVRLCDEGIKETGTENVRSVLLYIKGNGSDAGGVTIEQLNIFIGELKKRVEAANIQWGMGDGRENRDNISVLIILGYGKQTHSLR